MELLITSTRPTQLILGKVTAVGVSLLQVACIVISGLIGFSIAKGSYPEVVLMVFESSLTPDSIFVMIFFSLFGFFLYTFIYASLGSLVSRIEDLASGVMPITFVAMIALFLRCSQLMMDCFDCKFTSFIACLAWRRYVNLDIYRESIPCMIFVDKKVARPRCFFRKALRGI